MNTELDRYNKSLAEAKTYVDQIVSLIKIFNKKHGTTAMDSIESIRLYFQGKGDFLKDFPPFSLDLFQSFLDSLSKNPGLGGFPEVTGLGVASGRPVVVRQVEDVEIAGEVGRLYGKILETFRFSHNLGVGEY